jgi:hypothetical protein
MKGRPRISEGHATVRSHGCMEIIVPPSARTAATVASASSTYKPHPTTKALSRAKVRAASRPIPPAVPVMMHNFAESLFVIFHSSVSIRFLDDRRLEFEVR